MKGSTVRFDKLVKESGSPEAETLWVEPEKDPELMRAVKANRVLTIRQQNVGTKKDFGLVGFFKEKNAFYLVFPRKILAPAETKVIGIKYDKLAAPKIRGSEGKPAKEKPGSIPPKTKAEAREKPVAGPSLKKKPMEIEAPVHRFGASVRLVAQQIISLEVEAHSLAEAKKLLLNQTEGLDLDLEGAELSKRMGTVKRMK